MGACVYINIARTYTSVQFCEHHLYKLYRHVVLNILSKMSNWSPNIFQWQLSTINFTVNYPPIRNNLTSASLLSMLIETDYLNYPPIRINLTSATPRTTGCLDDRLLTMMTDKGFYVP